MTICIAFALYQDEVGSVYSTEVVLGTVLLVLGAIAGLTSYRDAIAQELGDVSVALDSIDQSYSYTLTTGGGSVTRQFVDATTLTDPVNGAPAGLVLTTPAAGE